MISKQLEEFLDKYSREKHFPDIRPPPLLVDFYSDCLAEELEYVRQVERISLVLSDVNDLEEKSLEQAEALRKKHLGKKTSKSHHTSFQTFSDCNLKLLSFFGFESASNEQTILGKMIVYTQTKNEVQKAAVIYGHFTQQSEGGAVKYVPTGKCKYVRMEETVDSSSALLHTYAQLQAADQVLTDRPAIRVLENETKVYGYLKSDGSNDYSKPRIVFRQTDHLLTCYLPEGEKPDSPVRVLEMSSDARREEIRSYYKKRGYPMADPGKLVVMFTIKADGTREAGSQLGSTGTYHIDDVYTFEGDMGENFEAHGSGRATFHNPPEVHTGIFHRGQMVEGIIEMQGGKYIGKVREAKPHGMGIHLEEGGNVYIGEFVQGVRQGAGSLYIADLNAYLHGSFDKNLPCRQTTILLSDGSLIEGTIERGVITTAHHMKKRGSEEALRQLQAAHSHDPQQFLQHLKKAVEALKGRGQGFEVEYRGPISSKLTYTGRGRLFDESIGLYNGDFVDGLMEGEGCLELLNGDQYQGFFSQDTFEGQGKYSFADGGSYVGWFERGKYHGFGILKRDKKKLMGTWENGVLTMPIDSHDNDDDNDGSDSGTTRRKSRSSFSRGNSNKGFFDSYRSLWTVADIRPVYLLNTKSRDILSLCSRSNVRSKVIKAVKLLLR